MTVDRHFVLVGDRKVHLRVAGAGPVVLLVHQSPRSSAEYEPLMQAWSRHFTCIAPDTPGFGQSDPLAEIAPDIGHYADALLALLDVLGLSDIAAYGFHSGSVILVEAARRDPDRFSALALGGYAFWSPAELARFGDDFLPPVQPSAFGEHLAWLWNRVLEQTWFFPWQDARDEARLPAPHDDPGAVHVIVEEILAAGDAYRAGYGAVVRAPRDLSAFRDRPMPVLLAAYEDDPLFAHLERSGPLPSAWRLQAVAGEAELLSAAEAHLRLHAARGLGEIPLHPSEGFVAFARAGSRLRLHWRGARTPARVVLHAPGGAADLLDLEADELAIDLPGHGLSDPLDDADAASIHAWIGIIAVALGAIIRDAPAVIAGEGASVLLAMGVAPLLDSPAVEGVQAHLPPPERAAAWASAVIPDVSPTRFGEHLQRAWGAVRARQLFWPWFDACADNAIPLAAGALEPERLAREHLALLRARNGATLLSALLSADRAALLRASPPVIDWRMDGWAGSRSVDHIWPVWHPTEIING